jgi:hypothetical protein
MRDTGTPAIFDIIPCDYDLFAKLKEILRGTCYNTREDIIGVVGRSLLDINKSGPGTSGL